MQFQISVKIVLQPTNTDHRPLGPAHDSRITDTTHVNRTSGAVHPLSRAQMQGIVIIPAFAQKGSQSHWPGSLSPSSPLFLYKIEQGYLETALHI